MKMTTPTRLDATLLALADPTRRAIVRRLALGEARVTEVAAPFPMSLNAVSKHIRALERAGLVQRRVVGREHILSFNPAPLDEAAAWIASQQATWQQRLDVLEALLAEEGAIDTEDDARREKGMHDLHPQASTSSTLEREITEMAQPEHNITIVREIDAPASAVYAAWTDPAIMRRWIASELEAEVRVGGSYRHVVDAGEAGRFVHSGQYLVLDPERRIVQTFQGANEGADAADDSSDVYQNERLEIVLRPLGPTRTELTFSNVWEGQALSEEDLAATTAGWDAWLDQLAALF
jgi:uncharacterized protein YndB with AHSA1/START domain/DNA-binding transcriptional ArsR family regulator